MRRIVIWLASTVTIVVLLFGYHTSTNKTSFPGVPGSTFSPTTSTGKAKLGRNDPCWCGSGKKFKKCHGR